MVCSVCAMVSTLMPRSSARTRSMSMASCGCVSSKSSSTLRSPGFFSAASRSSAAHCLTLSKSGPPTYDDVGKLAKVLVKAAPERMLWATNWPHPGQVDPPTPTQLAALRDAWLPSDALRRRVLIDNPAEVYGFEPCPTPEEAT